MKYLRGRLIIAKHKITFNRGIRSSFETYRQDFYRFANLALILSRFFSRKYNLRLSYFRKTEIFMKFAVTGKHYIYLRHNDRTLIVSRKKA